MERPKAGLVPVFGMVFNVGLQLCTGHTRQVQTPTWAKSSVENKV